MIAIAFYLHNNLNAIINLISTFLLTHTFPIAFTLCKSNGSSPLSSSSECESAINAGNRVCNYPDNNYYQCGTTEVTNYCNGTIRLCSDNAILTSTAQKIASVCYIPKSGTSISIDYKFTSQTINDAFTAAGYYTSTISLFTCQFDCSANFTVKVNSISNCNLYFSTEASTLPVLSQKAYKEGKTGGEYSYSFSSSGTNRIYVYMLPSINDSSQKMTANYTIALADCGYSIYNPYAASSLVIRNGTSTICNNNSTSNSESTKESLSTVDIIQFSNIYLIFSFISLAICLLIVIILIMYHKLRVELRGYDPQSQIVERMEIQSQTPDIEDRQNSNFYNIEKTN